MTAPPDGSYPQTARTTPTRHRERAGYDRAAVHAILDADWICHLGFVADGAPVVLPTLYARVADRLYLHGSTGSRPLRTAARAPHTPPPDGGAEPGGSDAAEGERPSGARTGSQDAGPGDGLRVCVTVTIADGLVLARSAFHHSVNYRSVVAHGVARRVTDPAERAAALDAIVDAAVPGRSADCRPATPKELAQTAVLRLDLEEVSAKVRAGGVAEDPEDLALPHWAGVVPLTRSLGAAQPDPALAPGTPLPAYLPAP
ncbi:pyridoxamine 5'-phosphate oxidase family protein [Nocardiopsis mangrovi]|uniref:Pyridoxamine 5'-phosphate oxidase family protein n=1 Tax=Nocardiopsis mangrovi TaxID=1179818 RepID=A0ABV9E0L4_9ACTN